VGKIDRKIGYQQNGEGWGGENVRRKPNESKYIITDRELYNLKFRLARTKRAEYGLKKT